MTTPERAETVPELRWRDGKTRHRCSVCGKITFESEEAAIAAARKIREARGAELQQYKGRHPREYGQSKGTPCGWWHLRTVRRR